MTTIKQKNSSSHNDKNDEIVNYNMLNFIIIK